MGRPEESIYIAFPANGRRFQNVSDSFSSSPGANSGKVGSDVSEFPNTGLIVSHPMLSGHGKAAMELDQLGLFPDVIFFKHRPRDAEDGFERVVKPHFNPMGLAVVASMYFPSVWSEDLRRYRWAHLTSPHFFHLARGGPPLTGIVHDLGHLDPPGTNRSPVGYRYLMNKELHRASLLRGIVTISDTTRERLVQFSRDLDPVTIHNWTNEEFRFREMADARAQLGLPAERRLLLSVGLDIPRKNIDLLPRLVRALGPGVSVVRIGDSRRIASAFPPGTLIDLPSVSEASYPLFFNAVDALVYPSVDEGFGRPLIEAINSGTPVVASDIPVFREVTRSSEWLVPVGRLDAWVEGCRRAFEVSKSGRRDGGLFRGLGEYYRPGRARGEYLAFFRARGLS
jgi:glycosyltransferase involved in cell wall biosynthesis